MSMKLKYIRLTKVHSVLGVLLSRVGEDMFGVVPSASKLLKVLFDFCYFELHSIAGD